MRDVKNLICRTLDLQARQQQSVASKQVLLTKQLSANTLALAFAYAFRA
jgi:hypothetical protein